MNILITEDVRSQLDALTAQVREVFPHAVIHSESEPERALRRLEDMAHGGQSLAYAFLAIRMERMSGIQLARRIRVLFPRAAILFCTAYRDYAAEAMQLHAKGYLLKPVQAQDIVRTLDEMVEGWREQAQAGPREIRVQAFGHFEFFVDGKPLVFKREKAKELLAFLIDHHGEAVSTEQIVRALWEDRPCDRAMKNHVSSILSSLRRTLDAAGLSALLIKTPNHLALDIRDIRCDAYDYERAQGDAWGGFKGEYMVNYSWAEFTTGRYVTMEHERRRRMRRELSRRS